MSQPGMTPACTPGVGRNVAELNKLARSWMESTGRLSGPGRLRDRFRATYGVICRESQKAACTDKLWCGLE